MWQCQKCGDFKLDSFGEKNKCNCKPFTVVDEDGEDHEVFSISERQAALKYAEDSNTNGDYYLMNDSVDITVNGKPYRISAEPDVHYSANEIK